MPEIQELFEVALRDEPPLTVRAVDVLAVGRARARRRRVGVLTGAAVAVGGMVAAATLIPFGSSPAPATTSRPAARGLSLAAFVHSAKLPHHPAASPRRASTTAHTSVFGLTPSQLTQAVERELQIRLDPRGADAEAGPAGGYEIWGGIASRHGLPTPGESLTVDLAPAGSLQTTKPDCAELGSGPDGDGYVGPCVVSTLPDGSYLVVRSGHTRTGGLRAAQAALILPDGSGITAEVLNQHFQARWQRRGDHVELVPPTVVSVRPPVAAKQLGALVRRLAAR